MNCYHLNQIPGDSLKYLLLANSVFSEYFIRLIPGIFSDIFFFNSVPEVMENYNCAKAVFIQCILSNSSQIVFAHEIFKQKHIPITQLFFGINNIMQSKVMEYKIISKRN